MASSSSSGGFNILSHQVSEKLTQDNFLLWKAQVVPAVRGAQLIGFLEGTKEKPAETTKEKEPNPAYQAWLTQDALLSYLNSSLSKEVLAQVATCTTSHEVWKEINNMYASQSRARVMHLRGKLATTRKKDMTAAAYFAKMKGYADEMAAAGKRLEDDDVVSYILTGLDSDYNALVETVSSRTEPISLSDLYAQLVSTEARLEAQNNFQMSTNAATRGGHSFGRGRGREGSRDGGRGRGGFGRGGGRGSANRPECHVCGKV
jgi:hypothetical protein